MASIGRRVSAVRYLNRVLINSSRPGPVCLCKLRSFSSISGRGDSTTTTTTGDKEGTDSKEKRPYPEPQEFDQVVNKELNPGAYQSPEEANAELAKVINQFHIEKTLDEAPSTDFVSNDAVDLSSMIRNSWSRVEHETEKRMECQDLVDLVQEQEMETLREHFSQENVDILNKHYAPILKIEVEQDHS